MVAVKEWQYVAKFRCQQPGKVGVVEKRDLGGWHVPAVVLYSVLLGLEKTSMLLLCFFAFEPKGVVEMLFYLEYFFQHKTREGGWLFRIARFTDAYLF